MMFSETYYLVRSKADGSYLAARPRQNPDRVEQDSFVLLFREHFEALSYLNTHAADLADRFSVESIVGSQVGSLLKRWNFTGMGMVNDPLLPSIEFLLQTHP
jgi:hypothetical protein